MLGMGFSTAVRTTASSAIEPDRGISRSGHLAGMRIGAQNEIVLADQPACSGLDGATKAYCAHKLWPFGKFLRNSFSQGDQGLKSDFPPSLHSRVKKLMYIL